ncbi:hypothetical protein [Xanthomonas fragariae]|uniref:hypothetical protein n=1 Tax=Xanthomonas fragariae TaxID=48664 RepID=UPI000A35C403|nr:hypothetical protein [Xanthomonas fragariae]SMQ93667.1 hypothetical protein NBC2815_00303 [Xanthomonas fragariae]
MKNDHRVFIDAEILVLGQRRFIKSVAIPLYEQLEEIAPNFPEPDDNDHFENIVHSNPQAFFNELGGVATVGVFLSEWAAKKLLDEIYEATIRPRFKKVFEDFFNRSSNGKFYSTAISAKSRLDNNIILVLSIGRSMEEIEACNNLVSTAFQKGIDQIKDHPDGTVRSYIIEDRNIRFSGHYQSRVQAVDALAKSMSPFGTIKAMRHDG